jgi:DNA-binding NarL/FixJ family response regulator
VNIAILIVEDHRLLREGLTQLLTQHPDFEVVGGAENGRMALEMARRLHPDVVIMDMVMPDLNGVEATRQICKRQIVPTFSHARA